MNPKGCCCGKYLLPKPGAPLFIRPASGGPGEVHRYSLACYREGFSKQAGPALPRSDTLEGLHRRVEQLERTVSRIIGLEDE